MNNTGMEADPRQRQVQTVSLFYCNENVLATIFHAYT